ncbi:MAG: DUF4959 domain-containing protein [Flavobacteriaceae bacterium]|jgi:hypothetical protein|nr:DUF4959 domain-containing protein [Flavobacteriaceae bacterium]|tara:strand:+ start:727 stop:1932 length:1206 start_codon:yes stop_codon:yes gene_type:complete
MKKSLKKIISVFTILLITVSCQDTESGDVTAPGKLIVETITPTNGGGIISYTLPDDSDILFVRAEYTNTLGEDVFRVSSVHNNEVEISGLNQTTPIEVNLFVVDNNDNKSEPTTAEFVPLESFIYLVQESIEFSADLGGVRVSWENIESKTVYVYVHIQNGEDEEIRILSSNSPLENRFIRGLEATELTFLTKVADFDGNVTDLEEKGVYSPLFEEVIDKSTWSLVSNQSINGNAWEGSTVNFWDDIVDTTQTDSDNSYFIIWRDQNGGTLNWPLDIVVNLNKNVKINRLKVWQRAFWYNGPSPTTAYYYQEENMKSFDLFASNNGQEWTLLGQYDIGNPMDADGNIPSDAMESAANGHDFELDGVSESFNYLKISITSNYGSDTYCHGSEITLYGLDNLD